jgi:hypothetical protein
MAGIQAATPTTGVQLIVATFTIPGGGAFQPVTWDSEVYDPDDWWTTGNLLTVPSTGNYDVDYTFDVTQSTPSSMTVDITVNAVSVDSESFIAGTTPLAKTVSGVALVAGDIFRIEMQAPPDGLEIVTGTLTITPA